MKANNSKQFLKLPKTEKVLSSTLANPLKTFLNRKSDGATKQKEVLRRFYHPPRKHQPKTVHWRRGVSGCIDPLTKNQVLSN